MNASVDLRPDHLESVRAILREHVPGVEARAFGSRATWTAKDHSDLDLVIVGSGPLDRTTLGLLKEAFEESNLPMQVDVLDWHDISQSFRREIEREYVVVQEGAIQTTVEREVMVGEWHEVTIDDIAEKVAMGPFGSSIKVETFVPEGVPIISGQHLHGPRVDDAPGFNFIRPEHAQRLANANVTRGDIVLTHRGTIGQVAYIPSNSRFRQYVVSQSQFYVRCDQSKAIPEFVALYLESPEGQHQLLANTSQVGVPSIAQPVTYLRTMHIPLPPLPEQRDIAHVLGTLDDKIELNRRMNETLEEMARALFKSWFVDFDPVRAKMEGRWLPGESLPGLPADLYDLFPDRLVDSELGEIPKGWGVKSLGELIELNPEAWSKSNGPSSVEYVDLANTKWGVIESTQHFPWRDAPSRARRVLRPGDTIVGTVRPGNGSYSLIGDDGLTGSTGFAVLRPLERRVRELVYLAGTAKDNIERLANRADGAAYPAIRSDVVAETEVVIPSSDSRLLTAFSNVVGPILDTIAVNKTDSRAIAAKRDALLPKLVAGSVKAGE